MSWRNQEKLARDGQEAAEFQQAVAPLQATELGNGYRVTIERI
jgi:hypothetical protein